MEDTRLDVIVPNAVWVNLYAQSGVTVGNAVSIINKGVSACLICISPSTPATTTVGMPLYSGGQHGDTLSISADATGLWAYVSQGSTRLLVEDVSGIPPS